MITLITGIINESLMEGNVPGSLQIGKMTLIDKKEPSLEVSKKRRITVSSVILSLITKIIHKRMNKICEREGFYGSVQYGFRQKRSTTDCMLMILAALRVAKRKNNVSPWLSAILQRPTTLCAGNCCTLNYAT